MGSRGRGQTGAVLATAGYFRSDGLPSTGDGALSNATHNRALQNYMAEVLFIPTISHSFPIRNLCWAAASTISIRNSHNQAVARRLWAGTIFCPASLFRQNGVSMMGAVSRELLGRTRMRPEAFSSRLFNRNVCPRCTRDPHSCCMISLKQATFGRCS